MSLLSQVTLNPNIVFETENTEIIKRFVEHDIGISLLPELSIRKEIETNTLHIIPVTFPIPPVYIKIIYHKNKWVSPTMRNFIQLISPN